MDWRSATYFIFDGEKAAAQIEEVLENFRGFLKSYKEHGLNSVTLTWFNPVSLENANIELSYGNDVPVYLSSLPTTDLLGALTHEAHEQGFKVAWKPHFVTNDSEAGNVNAYFAGEDFPADAFLKNVNSYWSKLAPSAETYDVELLIVGTEHGDYAVDGYESAWRNIISTVRDSYSGKVTYDALSYVGRPVSAADDIKFWDALDYIGISMYLPLGDEFDDAPTLGGASTALYNNHIYGNSTPLVDVPALLQDLSEQYGKPILFAEAGSMSRKGALYSPPSSTGQLDFKEQTILYATLLNEFSRYDWFEGINWWTNDHDFKAPPGTQAWEDFWFPLHETEFSFIEKPAGDVVRAFWANGEVPYIELDGTVIIGLDDIDDIFGTEDGDIIIGKNGDDFLRGSGGSDMLLGEKGHDHLEGAFGNDFLGGGPGTDTAVYSGNQVSYTLTLTPASTTVEDRRVDGNGTDDLIDMELLDFDSGDVDPFDLTVFGGPTTLSQENFESFIELYIAYFNRAPDAIGLNFWGTAFANGTSLEEMATLFIDQEETLAAYPEGTSNTVFAETVFNNVLGRTPDQDGLDFWVGVLDSGDVTRDQFILEVLRGAKSDLKPELGQDFVDQQLADRDFLTTKTDIGAYFAVHKGMSDVDNASAAMALFDGTEASIDTAVSAVDDYYADALDPATGEFLMQLVGVLDDPFAGV